MCGPGPDQTEVGVVVDHDQTHTTRPAFAWISSTRSGHVIIPSSGPFIGRLGCRDDGPLGHLLRFQAGRAGGTHDDEERTPTIPITDRVLLAGHDRSTAAGTLRYEVVRRTRTAARSSGAAPVAGRASLGPAGVPSRHAMSSHGTTWSSSQSRRRASISRPCPAWASRLRQVPVARHGRSSPRCPERWWHVRLGSADPEHHPVAPSEGRIVFTAPPGCLPCPRHGAPGRRSRRCRCLRPGRPSRWRSNRRRRPRPPGHPTPRSRTCARPRRQR